MQQIPKTETYIPIANKGLKGKGKINSWNAFVSGPQHLG